MPTCNQAHQDHGRARAPSSVRHRHRTAAATPNTAAGEGDGLPLGVDLIALVDPDRLLPSHRAHPDEQGASGGRLGLADLREAVPRPAALAVRRGSSRTWSGRRSGTGSRCAPAAAAGVGLSSSWSAPDRRRAVPSRSPPRPRVGDGWETPGRQVPADTAPASALRLPGGSLRGTAGRPEPASPAPGSSRRPAVGRCPPRRTACTVRPSNSTGRNGSPSRAGGGTGCRSSREHLDRLRRTTRLRVRVMHRDLPHRQTGPLVPLLHRHRALRVEVPHRLHVAGHERPVREAPAPSLPPAESPSPQLVS